MVLYLCVGVGSFLEPCFIIDFCASFFSKVPRIPKSNDFCASNSVFVISVCIQLKISCILRDNSLYWWNQYDI